MKQILSLTLIAALAVIPFTRSTAAEATWSESYTEAQAKAESEGKPMLLLFTGSDWCGFCIKLEKSIFDSEEFAAYTDENYVLVKADFPRRKAQSKEQVKHNEKLAAEFGVEGFPTVLVVSPDGEKVLERKVGYGGDSPAEYIEGLKKYESQT
jgi:protein disulfide-isomerase|tara:strand:- start:734 stop:1192 length:459 start_codon:yes stop_codon:yes gene_type:complete